MPRPNASMLMIMMLCTFQALIQLCPTPVGLEEHFQYSQFVFTTNFTLDYNSLCSRGTSFAPGAGVRQNHVGEADARSRASGPTYYQGWQRYAGKRRKKWEGKQLTALPCTSKTAFPGTTSSHPLIQAVFLVCSRVFTAHLLSQYFHSPLLFHLWHLSLCCLSTYLPFPPPLAHWTH